MSGAEAKRGSRRPLLAAALAAMVLGPGASASPVQDSGGPLIAMDDIGSVHTGSSRRLAISPDGARLVVTAFTKGRRG